MTSASSVLVYGYLFCFFEPYFLISLNVLWSILIFCHLEKQSCVLDFVDCFHIFMIFNPARFWGCVLSVHLISQLKKFISILSLLAYDLLLLLIYVSSTAFCLCEAVVLCSQCPPTWISALIRFLISVVTTLRIQNIVFKSFIFLFFPVTIQE
jgi:hypothetical protein